MVKILNIAWGLGFQIAFPAILLTIMGVFLDKTFNTKPTITIISILLGPTIGFLNGLKEIKKLK